MARLCFFSIRSLLLMLVAVGLALGGVCSAGEIPIYSFNNLPNGGYESQREAPHSRALSRLQNIRMKLGGSGSLADDFPGKPNGMHWRTYNRLCREAEEAQDQSWPPWFYKVMARSVPANHFPNPTPQNPRIA